MPAGAWGNDVVGTSAGGFFVTSTADISDGVEEGVARMAEGAETGKVVEWSQGKGWRDVPGSQMNSTNGLCLSPDESYLYVAGWNSRCIRRVKLDVAVPEVQTVPMPIMVDNITLSGDGHLLAAGAARTSMETFAQQFFGSGSRCVFPTEVVKVHLSTLSAETIIAYDDDSYGVATTALEVGDQVLVGSMRCSGVARFA